MHANSIKTTIHQANFHSSIRNVDYKTTNVDLKHSKLICKTKKSAAKRLNHIHYLSDCILSRMWKNCLRKTMKFVILLSAVLALSELHSAASSPGK